MKERWLNISVNLLIILWIYTAGSKLTDIDLFEKQLHLQPFSHLIANLLLYILPISEFAIAVLLIFSQTRRPALLISLIFICAFTIFIALVLNSFFEHRPCSCGGVLSMMTWQQHMFFNFFFLGVNILAIYLQAKVKGGQQK
jgi:uncharacterized membrane protein YphA (DoxX/SURF4 family)